MLLTVLPPARQQVIVLLVSADPKPEHIVAVAACDGAVIPPYVGGPNLALGGETYRRMERILSKQPILLPG